MTDHGFDKTEFMSSLEDIVEVANDISKERDMVAVHVVEMVGDKGHYGIIVLGDKVVALREVIRRKCSEHSIKIRSTETWHSITSFRNGKQTTNAFV